MTWPDRQFQDFIELVSKGSKLEISYDAKELESPRDNENCRYGGHCMIWAKTDKSFKTKYRDVPLIALVNVSFHAQQKQNNYCIGKAFQMHLRWDGSLGFPGGFLEENESIVDGTSREIEEEMGVDSAHLQLTPQDFVFKTSQQDVVSGKMLHLFFFSKEVCEQTFLELEENSRKAQHFGTEVLGNIRVPLHLWRTNEGFPKFLTNSFIGTAKLQLLLALNRHGIMDSKTMAEYYAMHH